jgi:hypothetical protein
VRRLWLGASGAQKLCALGAIGRFCEALNFTVRRLPGVRTLVALLLAKIGGRRARCPTGVPR